MMLWTLASGRLTVSSKVRCGSTFTFILPYKVSQPGDNSEDSDELSDMVDHEATNELTDDDTVGFFQFQPRTLGYLFSSNGSSRSQKLGPHNIGFANPPKLNGFSGDSFSFPMNNVGQKDVTTFDDACSEAQAVETCSDSESSFSHSPDADDGNPFSREKQCEGDSNVQFKNSDTNMSYNSQDNGVTSKISEFQISPQTLEKPDAPNDSPIKPESSLKPNILLVEDNNVNVMVARKMTRQLGLSIDVVNNGVEAVRAVQSHNYDLILMDVCMPVMDGLKATRLIRSFEETGNWDAAAKECFEQLVPSSDLLQNGHGSTLNTKRIPIIAMTANALSESADECYENGMDSFVSKPITLKN